MSLLFRYHHERCPYLPKVMLSPCASCDCEKYATDESSVDERVPSILEQLIAPAPAFTISVNNDGPTHWVKAKIREVLLDEFGNVIAAAPWPEDDNGEDA